MDGMTDQRLLGESGEAHRGGVGKGDIGIEVETVDAVADRIQDRLIGGFELTVAFRELGAQACNGQVGLDPGNDLFGLKRFCDVIHRAQGQALDLVIRIVECGQEDDRNILGLRVVFQARTGLEAIDTGHHYVEQDEIGLCPLGHLQCILAALGHQQFMAQPLQGAEQELQVGRVVVDQQDGAVVRLRLVQLSFTGKLRLIAS